MYKILLIFLFSFSITTSFSQKVYTPASGTPERKMILDVIRKPTETELGQPIQFVCHTFRISGDWAFVNGMMQQPNGKEIDDKKFKNKDFLEMAENGVFDDNFQAILIKKEGKWTIFKRAMGCTDVCWANWLEDKNVPKEIFPK